MDDRVRGLVHSGTIEGTSNAEWETPPDVFDALNREFTFSVDLTGGPGTQHRLPHWIGPDSRMANCQDLAEVPADVLVDRGFTAGYSNPPYGPFIQQTAMPFALQAQSAGLTTVWLLPLRITESFKRVIMSDATEVRICERRITFWERGEPRWNRKLYNESLLPVLLETTRTEHGQQIAKDLVAQAVRQKVFVWQIPSFYEMLPRARQREQLHEIALKRPDPAPFDSIVVVFRPHTRRSGLKYGPEFKLWRWW